MLVLAMALAATAAAQDLSYREELLPRARDLKLAQSPAWLALGHYRGGKSEVEPSEFFTAPDGRRDPQAELDATLTAFFEPEPDPAKDPKAQHPQCRFPARYALLKARLAFDPKRLPERACPRYEEWRQTLGATAVTVVFADAFLNNPASMYGHTFLRLRREGSGEDDLLDYTVNFAGTPDTDNAVFYAIEGIFGLFPGAYSTMPYYMKTQEYTNSESRDLWEYDLSLSTAQTAALVRHLWEMGSAKFRYYFFSENCSYQLLTLVDGAVPELNLAHQFGFGVVPLDTVRAFGRRGLYSSARRRPSHVSQLRARRARLNAGEVAIAAGLARGREGAWERLRALQPERQALTLDSADDYLRFLHGFGPDLPKDAAKTARDMLVTRGRLGLPPMTETYPERLRPDQGHRTHRVGLLQGADNRGGFTELQYRVALHDLGTPGEGYIADSQLEMGDLRLRYDYREKEPFIEKFDVVDIVTLAPIDSWLKRASWKASFGVDQARELGCVGVSCMYGALNAGVGPSFATTLLRREVWYAFAEADFGAAPVFRQGWRAGAGGSAGVVLDLSSRWRAQAEGQFIHYQAETRRTRARASLSYQVSTNLELRGAFDRRHPSTEGSLAVLLYF